MGGGIENDFSFELCVSLTSDDRTELFRQRALSSTNLDCFRSMEGLMTIEWKSLESRHYCRLTICSAVTQTERARVAALCWGNAPTHLHRAGLFCPLHMIFDPVFRDDFYSEWPASVRMWNNVDMTGFKITLNSMLNSETRSLWQIRCTLDRPAVCHALDYFQFSFRLCVVLFKDCKLLFDYQLIW